MVNESIKSSSGGRHSASEPIHLNTFFLELSLSLNMILKTKLCHCHCDRPKLPWGCSGGLDFLCVQAKGRTNEDVHEVLADLKRIHANIEGCYLLFVNAGRNRRRK